MLNMVLKCQYHIPKDIKNKNIIRKDLIKNIKNLEIKNQLIKNKNLIQNIKKKLDVLNVVKKVI